MTSHTEPNSGTTVLVTGGSGFIASYVILILLSRGYTLRTTIRNLSREAEVRGTLRSAGAQSDILDQRLTFLAADLSKDEGWADAVKGCTYVQHIASPFPSDEPKSEEDLIVPAREGTLRVLRAARAAGTVKRVVMTSSFGTIAYGHPPRDEAFTEKDWSVVDGPASVGGYIKSKTLAEKAAWDFIAAEGGALELTVINPVGTFGPILSDDFSASIGLVRSLMNGSMPAAPQLHFCVVDARDVAELQYLAMLASEAKGERFIGAADGEPVSLLDVASMIRAAVPKNSKKVPTWEFPNWVVKALAVVSPSIKSIVPQLGNVKRLSNEKAKVLLGWSPRAVKDTIADTAESLIQHHIV